MKNLQVQQWLYQRVVSLPCSNLAQELLALLFHALCEQTPTGNGLAAVLLHELDKLRLLHLVEGDVAGHHHLGQVRHKGWSCDHRSEQLLLACLTFLKQIKVLLVLFSLNVPGKKALLLVVKVVGAEFAEEGLIPDIVLPHLTPTKLADEEAWVQHLRHFAQATLRRNSEILLCCCFSFPCVLEQSCQICMQNLLFLSKLEEN